MGLFSPYKRHANPFNYIPRYFDPEKERREQRRAELRGERSDDTAEYTPGKYIRTQRAARAARREESQRTQSRPIWKLLLGAVAMLLLIAILLPRLVTAFQTAGTKRAEEALPTWQARETADELDQRGISDLEWQAQPITIVPNDYQGE